MKFLILFISIFFLNGFLYAEDGDCSSQMIQVMKPAHPDTGYQGFAVVKFNIDTSGKPKNIKAINSECAIKRDKEGNIVLKRCPFFKSSAVNAAKFIRFNPPIDSKGNSCELTNKTYEYKFSLYDYVELEYDDFFIREDFKKDRFSSEPGDVRMFRENQLQNLQQPPTLTQKAAAIQNAKP
tara:strand:- start:167 stop:709 length:543 start_codon:yes stop_codon:yes gene_type:complete